MMTSPWHPLMNIKYKVFLSASGVPPNSTNADRDFTERLATLIRTIRPYADVYSAFVSSLKTTLGSPLPVGDGQMARC